MKIRTALAVTVTTAMAVVSLSAMPASAHQGSTPPPTVGAVPSAVPSAVTPSVDDGDVQSIAQVGNTMVIGGNFTSVAGQTRNHAAAFDATSGALSSGFNPNINGTVETVLPGPTAGTVYVGGNFTTVGSTSIHDLALLNVSDGSVVTSFKTPLINFNSVMDLVLKGNRLYISGTFTKVGGLAHGGLAALNATTGALDPFMNVQVALQHNVNNAGAVSGTIGVNGMDVTADGSKMVIIGNFATADGLSRNQIALIDLTGASAQVATDWQTNDYAPACFGWAFGTYIRDVSFSPDGAYFVVNATGGGNAGTLCDATARFETSATGTNVQPTWVDETGGDTVWGIAVTDTAVFIGGHNRWNNNPTGSDYAGPGAVPRPGLAALDPVSGRPLTWNPGHNPLGAAVYAILPTATGLWIGYDTLWIGNYKYKRPRLAFFPYAGGYTTTPTTTGTLPGTAYLGNAQGATDTTDVLYRVNAGGPALQATDNGPDWAADTSDPSPYRNTGSSAAGYSPSATLDSTVPDTTPSAIFDSERWDASGGNEMEWTFPVAAGTAVEVRLFLANRCTCTDSKNERVFDVDLNGSRWLNREDLVADVGDQTATMKAKDITVPSNGVVDIKFDHEIENPLVNGIEIVRTDAAPPAGATDSLTTIGLTTTSAAAPQTADNGGVAWSKVRGAFMVGNKVYYGYTDGMLHSRTFDGTTWGPDVVIDPYHDPYWDGVDTHDGTTFDGTFPDFYGQITNLTGMFYSGGRVYYTVFGDSQLHSRWFSPDSGIIDQTSAVSSSSVNFNGADGMFVSNGTLYYVTKANGNLNSVAFSGGAVSGASTVVSGPSIDGINWVNRGLFLYNGPAANQAPTAAFTSNCTAAACSFNGGGSADSDGTVASYAWNFGDGTTGTGATPNHTYTVSGTYSVTLVVTDNKGAVSAGVSHDVTATVPPGNVPPTAAFTSSCTDGACSFNGGGSADSDGTVASYAWDFGDGSTGTGATPNHTYTVSGTYSVTLVVTDNKGAASTPVSHDVSVTVPVVPSGVAFRGASHSAQGSSKSQSVVVPASAQVGDTALLFLTDTTAASTTGPGAGWTQVDSFTNATVASTLWRKTLTAGDLGSTVNFAFTTSQKVAATLAVYSGVDSADPIAASARAGDAGGLNHTTPSVSAPAGALVVSYWGDKSVAVSAWTAPAGVTSRDSRYDTGTSGRMSFLLADSNGGVPAGSYGGLLATTDTSSDKAVAWTVALNPAGAVAPNARPTAAFTSSCTDGACSFNGGGSADSDGTVASYAWDFGDGSTGTGATPNHTYTVSGTYSVTLVVTDNKGAASTPVSHDVSVTVPVVPSGVAFRGASHSAQGSSKSQSVVVPASAQVGDTALLFLTDTTAASTTGPGAGWTQVDSFTNATVASTLWRKTLTAGDLGSTVNFAFTTSQKVAATLAVYSGVDSADPIAASARAGDAGGLNHTTPSVSAPAGALVVSYWGDKSVAVSAWTAPAGVTSRDSRYDTGTSGRMSFLLADSNGGVPAGSYGGLLATTDTSSDKAVAWTVALNPA